VRSSSSVSFALAICNMHTLLSILVVLSPVLFLVSIPVFGWALRLATQAHGQPWSSGRIALAVVGCVGFLLDAAVVAFVIFDNPHGRFMDSIDSGPFTGVPTLFAISLSVFTMVVIAGLGLRKGVLTIDTSGAGW
jgi:hypothetical protein